MTDPTDTKEFDQAVEHLDAFGTAIKGLVLEVLRSHGIAAHSVEYRVKTWDSATRKLSIAEDKYSGFGDLKDLLGIRVITYFEDEVDKAAKALEPEFAVDKANSIDKRTLHDPDRFGYMSLHYIARLHSKRSRLVEYQRFADIDFELQIRSILQHAWAEIEHDLGYKAENSIPRDVRRRFSRLAGLLELADDEFIRLRTDLKKYERRVKATIQAKPESLGVDQSTLTALLEKPDLVALDHAVAEFFPADVTTEINTKYAAKIARDLRTLKVRDLQDVTRLIEERRAHLLTYADLWLNGSNSPDAHRRKGPLQRGISLFYLSYTLVATSDDETFETWLAGRVTDTKRREMLGKSIRATWAEVVARLGEPPDAHGGAPILDLK